MLAHNADEAVLAKPQTVSPDINVRFLGAPSYLLSSSWAVYPFYYLSKSAWKAVKRPGIGIRIAGKEMEKRRNWSILFGSFTWHLPKSFVWILFRISLVLDKNPVTVIVSAFIETYHLVQIHLRIQIPHCPTPLPEGSSRKSNNRTYASGICELVLTCLLMQRRLYLSSFDLVAVVVRIGMITLPWCRCVSEGKSSFYHCVWQILSAWSRVEYWICIALLKLQVWTWNHHASHWLLSSSSANQYSPEASLAPRGRSAEWLWA